MQFHVNYDPATVSAVSTEAEYVCLVEVKEIYERERITKITFLSLRVLHGISLPFLSHTT